MRFRLKDKPRTCSICHLRIKGAIVSVLPGETVDCEKYEIGNWINEFDQLDPDPPESPPVNTLTAKHRGAGRWGVFNEETGEYINSAHLTREVAEEIASGKVSISDVENTDDEDKDETEN